jgi:hypothetical protein
MDVLCNIEHCLWTHDGAEFDRDHPLLARIQITDQRPSKTVNRERTRGSTQLQIDCCFLSFFKLNP